MNEKISRNMGKLLLLGLALVCLELLTSRLGALIPWMLMLKLFLYACLGVGILWLLRFGFTVKPDHIDPEEEEAKQETEARAHRAFKYRG